MHSLLAQRSSAACLAWLLASALSLPAFAQQPLTRPPTISAATESGYLGLIGDDRVTGGRGVQVLSVRGRGAAEAAGLRAGDVLVSINHQPVNTVVQMAQQLAGLQAGAKIEIEFERSGKRYAVTPTLGPRPAADPVGPPINPAPNSPPTTALLPQTGASGKPTLGVRAIAPLEGARRGYVVYARQGALIEHIEPGSPADRYGLSLGSVIVALDGKRIDDAVDLVQAVAAVRPGEITDITFYRGDKLYRKQMRLTQVAAQPPLDTPNVDGVINPKIIEFPPAEEKPATRPRVPPPPPRPANPLGPVPADPAPGVLPKAELDPLLPPPAPAPETPPVAPPPAPFDPLAPPPVAPPVKAPVAPPVAAPVDPLIAAKPPLPNPLPPSVLELDRKLTDPPAAKPSGELTRLKAELADTVHRITSLQKEQQALLKSLEALQKAIDELETKGEK